MPYQKRVPIITDPAKLPDAVRRHLEYRLNEDEERRLTPREQAQLAYWIQGHPTAVPGQNWARDFGTFYTVGQGELWKSILTSKKNSQGIWVRMRPKSGDVRLAAEFDLPEPHPIDPNDFEDVDPNPGSLDL